MTLTHHRQAGMGYMIAASLAFATMGVFVKLAARTLPPLEIVFVRSAFGAVLIGGYMWYRKISFKGHAVNRPMLWARGMSGFLALSCFFYTVSRLNLVTAVLLNQVSPIFAVLLAFFFLKEVVTKWLWAYMIVAFVGVYFLIQPTYDYTLRLVSLVGILSALFAAAAYITIRALKEEESPFTVIFYFVGTSTVGSFFYLLLGARWPTLGEWGYLVGVGLFSSLGQLWLTVALRRAEAVVVSPFSYCTVFFAFVYGLLFFGEMLTRSALAGALLIVASGIAIARMYTKGVKS